jgi:uncharacterized protein YdaU (DUF1376 family)
MFSYQFHIRDYLTKTRHLSLLEDLAYRRLIDAYYTEEAPLPADVQACARLIAMRDNAQEVEAVLREFFSLTDDGWHNARCDQEIARYRALQESGRRASALRWKGPDGSPIKNPSGTHQEPIKNPMPTQCQPRTNNQEPETKKKPTSTSRPIKVDFDWNAGEWVNVDPLIPAWRDAYPDLDIEVELRKARAWVLANPDKAKSRWGSFLNNWLSRNGARSSAMPAAGRPGSTNVFEGLA